jgi:hypothetical protein
MKPSAPIVAVALLGSAVALVWLVRKEPHTSATETAAVSVEVRDADAAAPPAPEALPSLPPSQEQTAATAVRAEPELPRSPLPGEAVTMPLIQLIEDQRASNPSNAPRALQEGLPNLHPQLAKTELAFGAEPIDESWARGQETDILAKISQQQGLALLDLRVECRSTMCRLQMGQPGSQGAPAFRDLVKEIGMEPQWVMSLAGRGGSLNTVAYMWRDGYAPARPGLRSIADGDVEQKP